MFVGTFCGSWNFSFLNWGGEGTRGHEAGISEVLPCTTGSLSSSRKPTIEIRFFMVGDVEMGAPIGILSNH